MRGRIGLLGAAAVCLAGAAHADSPPDTDPLGRWARTDGETRIEIAPCGAALCATNIWVRDPTAAEKEGDVLEMHLTPRSPTELAGDADDRRRGLSYSVTMTFGPDGMHSEGCLLFGILCKAADWTRIR
jgi:uncharacterized protein (DUF2147 family)